MARNNSSPVQQFRGTTAQHATYTGLPGELTVDTDKNVVVVHDGVTAGGHPMTSAAATIPPYATNEKAGIVKPGAGLQIGEDGTLDVLVSAVLPGTVVAFAGSFGGEGNRHPIPLGSSEPDTSWVLCDGGTTTNGLPVPDLRGRMILGASDAHPAGSTGGSETHSHSLSGTVGDTTLTVEQMPSHTHGYRKVTRWNGWNGTNDGNDCKPPSDGQPTDATGGSQAHTHALSGEAGKADTLPPYYALSFVMRCA